MSNLLSYLARLKIRHRIDNAEARLAALEADRDRFRTTMDEIAGSFGERQ